MIKVGRNDPCHCGSGKKYKKCCLDKDLQASTVTVSKPEENIFWEDEEEDNNLNSGLQDYVEGNFSEESDEQEAEESITDQPYPEISAEENKIVDAWWETYENLEDPDKVRESLQSFMDDHPHLVENLALEHEVLFELGGDYKREGRHLEYFQFLFKVRNEFPSTYRRSAGYYDADIIAWLISNKRSHEIENYLNYLTDYPVDFAEPLFETVDLLLATDTVALLPDFILKICSKILSSSEINSIDILQPLVLHLLSKYLRPDFSEKDSADFVKELNLLIPSGLSRAYRNPDFWNEAVQMIMRPFERWPDNIPSKKSELNDRYMGMSGNFARYLRDRTGISWISAQYYSNLIYEYLIENLRQVNKKIRKQFDFSKKNIDKIIIALTQQIIHLNASKALATLNAIYYFADYLQACGNLDETVRSIIQNDCISLHKEIFPTLKIHYTEALCFDVFPLWHNNG